LCVFFFFFAKSAKDSFNSIQIFQYEHRIMQYVEE